MIGRLNQPSTCHCIFAVVALLSLFLAGNSLAQKRITIDTRFSTGSSNREEVRVFDSAEESEEALAWIAGTAGLTPNFTIKAADVDRAEAVLAGSDRYIFYNQSWLRNITSTNKTDWSKVMAVAHEMGHHLNGHTLLGTGSFHAIELEADAFAGFVLHKMGASVQEAEEAMEAFVRNYISDKYPPKAARLEAVSRGWLNARSKENSTADKSESAGTPELTIQSEIVSVFEPNREGSHVGNIGKGSTVDFAFQAEGLYGGDLLIWVERKKNGKYEKLRDQNQIFGDDAGDVFFVKEYIEPVYAGTTYEVSYSLPFKELHLSTGTNELRINAKYCKGFKCIDFPYGYFTLVVKNEKWGKWYKELIVEQEEVATR
ncbi:MAG: hypothetical protein RIF36_22495 [Imperialibacter sp.]|uniref:hypothetical protein n=1 Tax=Imperialibacter sp. TaxID=2038411 RepID=UPI0032EAB899